MNINKLKNIDEAQKVKLKKEMFAILDDLAEKNKNISFKELDKDIEHAKKHAPRID